jgi:hypothetical protein
LNERFEQYINGKRENVHSNFTLRLKKILWEARSTPTLVGINHWMMFPIDPHVNLLTLAGRKIKFFKGAGPGWVKLPFGPGNSKNFMTLHYVMAFSTEIMAKRA